MAKTVATEPLQIGVNDLALLIASASRLLTTLAAAGPFEKANIGLAEWLSLTLLTDRDGVSNKQLARALGVTGQRVNQVCASLAKAGLITLQQSSDDKRRNVIKVTAKGAQQVAALNAELQVVLETTLKGREKTLTGSVAYLRRLLRLMQDTSPAKADAGSTVQ
jgi:DNA-binding MarR family transcriptional regulator